MYTYKNTLPTVPSQLIRRALQDMEQVEKMPGYEIYLNTWHKPTGKICYVCLAGATMVVEGLPFDESILPADIEGERYKLFALNNFRCGFVDSAFSLLDIEWPEQLIKGVRITQYSGNPTQFKADMYDLADYLEQNGY